MGEQIIVPRDGEILVVPCDGLLVPRAREDVLRKVPLEDKAAVGKGHFPCHPFQGIIHHGGRELRVPTEVRR